MHKPMEADLMSNYDYRQISEELGGHAGEAFLLLHKRLSLLELLAGGMREGHDEEIEDDTGRMDAWQEDVQAARQIKAEDQWVGDFITAVRGWITADMADSGENAGMKEEMRERVMGLLSARQAGHYDGG